MKIKKAKNAKTPSSFEQMHLPWIKTPDFIKKGQKIDVIIKVGRVDHPMTKEHYVRCIRLYVNGEQYACKTLSLGNHSEVKFEIALKKNSVLKAVAECNLHGIWEDEKQVFLYIGNG